MQQSHADTLVMKIASREQVFPKNSLVSNMNADEFTALKGIVSSWSLRAMIHFSLSKREATFNIASQGIVMYAVDISFKNHKPHNFLTALDSYEMVFSLLYLISYNIFLPLLSVLGSNSYMK